jgi:AcrR family transcriptional regulator
MAGVSVGTLYNYYAFKEKLFLDIYIKESRDIRKLIMESIDQNEDSVTMVTKFVTQNIDAMNLNLILKEWYNRDLFCKLNQYFYSKAALRALMNLSIVVRLN